MCTHPVPREQQTSQLISQRFLTINCPSLEEHKIGWTKSAHHIPGGQPLRAARDSLRTPAGPFLRPLSARGLPAKGGNDFRGEIQWKCFISSHFKFHMASFIGNFLIRMWSSCWTSGLLLLNGRFTDVWNPHVPASWWLVTGAGEALRATPGWQLAMAKKMVGVWWIN